MCPYRPRMDSARALSPLLLPTVESRVFSLSSSKRTPGINPTNKAPHGEWTVCSFFSFTSFTASRMIHFQFHHLSSQTIYPPLLLPSFLQSPRLFSNHFSNACPSRTWPLLSSPATHPRPPTSADPPLRSSTGPSPPPPRLPSRLRLHVPGIRYVHIPFFL